MSVLSGGRRLWSWLLRGANSGERVSSGQTAGRNCLFYAVYEMNCKSRPAVEGLVGVEWSGDTEIIALLQV